MSFRYSGDVPPWALDLVRQIESEMASPQRAPVRLKSFENIERLPPAEDWVFGLVYLADIDMLAFSNGTNWKRTDTGATL
jgi:hypothetical protein